jgi:protein-disulfide isomerase
MSSSSERMTKNDRREAARQKAQALREQQERARKRNIGIGVGVLVLALGGLGYGVFVMAQQTTTARAEAAMYETAVALPMPTTQAQVPTLADVPLPSTADPATGGIPVSKDGVGTAADGGVVVDVYVDPICPYCGVFERANGSDLAALAAEPGVTVSYHLMTIMDNQSLGTHYSVRAANAMAVVADLDPNRFQAFMAAMFAEGVQPDEGTKGMNDAEIAAIAQGVGVPESVTEHFTDTVEFQGTTVRTYAPWMMANLGVAPVNPENNAVSTPTVMIDGVMFGGNYLQPGVLKQAIVEAVSAGS